MKNKIIKYLKDTVPELKAIYIFGSYANNTTTPQSDVDIAFLSDNKLDSVAIWKISNDLAYILKKDIDLVDLKETNTIFKFQIIHNGKRVYCSDTKEIEAYESLAYSFYLRFKEERAIIEQEILKNKRILDV